MKKRHSGFTLVEILVVLAVIGILAALLFPAFGRMHEKAAQANCASNLKSIGIAVMQYYQDEKAYPLSLTMLAPPDSSATTPVNPGGLGLIHSLDVARCPDDDTESTSTRHSYGSFGVTPNPALAVGTAPSDGSQYVWNYWGYRDDGYAYQTADEAATAQGTGPTYPYLVNTGSAYNHPQATGYVSTSPKNVVNHSLSNRYAPKTTVITHCVYHRIMTANDLTAATQLYYTTDPAAGNSAKDLVLLLSGDVKTLDVNDFKTTSAWLKQDF